MITRLLVANRGEIARRVFATCRRLGIETVAVHSDADAGLRFVAEADVAVRLAGNAPADTYLRADLVLEAARRAGADAVHPGYGFLSENADFARAVLEAGLAWVGPDPASIEQMGSKIRAKELMAAAGVPVLANLTAQTASPADLPLLVKASAGGGGRGMRIVRSLDDLAGEIEAAAAEARSAFGDGTVFVEPYVERGRHVEVQVMGHAGGVLVIGERDCSIQRRHQKVVEESPAPSLPEKTRRALHDAAGNAAAAIDYRGAGTVEFLYDPDQDRFYFLEMNTRLQVEHPVTELVHGVDLVEMQLAVAEGRAPERIGETYGHAIEVRLYAEDPVADYQPQSGVLTRFEVPGVTVEFDLLNRPGVRLDAGFTGGDEVSTHYDAMLAKLIAWAPERDQAARRLADTLAKARIHGVRTNRDLLVRVLRDGDVPGRRGQHRVPGARGLRDRAGRTTTPGLPWRPPWPWPSGRHAPARCSSGIPVAWRNVASQPQVTAFAGEVEVAWYGGRDGYDVDGYDVVAVSPTRVTLEADGARTSYEVAVTTTTPDDVVDVDGPHGHVRLVRVPRFTDPAAAVASGSLLAPMPGTVASVAVEVGDAVTAGSPVLVLEAMKMQHTVSAPTDGVLTRLDVRPGAQVAAGEVLAVVEPEEEEQG